MELARLSEKTLTFILLVYLILVYLPFTISRAVITKTFIQGDSYYYRAVLDSLLQDRDLALANNVSDDPLNGQLASGRQGLVPKHPILMPLVSLPFYILLGNVGLLLFNIFDCMLVIVLIFALNCLFFHRLIAFITAILYATTTLFLDYTFNYSPDIFSTVLVLTALYLTLQNRFCGGAFFLGLSIFAKITNLPLAGVILLYSFFLIWRRDPASQTYENTLRGKATVTAITFLCFVAALVPFALGNYYLFGSPIVTGYQVTAVADANGHVLSVDHSGKLNQPLLSGIALLLFDPLNGITLTNPIMILAALGVTRIHTMRSHDKALLVALLCVTQLVLFAKYDEWYTSHFSNRFLMTFIALSSVFSSNYLNYLALKSPLAAWTEIDVA